MSTTLCSCVYLPNDECCHKCVTRSWRFFVEKTIQEEIQKYKIKYPMMDWRYEKTFAKDIGAAIYKTIWKHHVGKLVEQIVPLLKKAAASAVEVLLERRETLVSKYFARAIENVIGQHFLLLSDKVDAPFTLDRGACDECKDNESFEPFPPATFRAWMVEKMLGSIHKSPEDNSCNSCSSSYTSRRLMHCWLDASPSERVEMGV